MKKQMLVGWGSSDVTPDRTVNMMGQFHVRITDSVNDPITVTALAMEGRTKGDRVIMISCDHSWLSDRVVREAREAIKSALPGFNSDNVIMSATHTHSAPALERFWYPELGPDVMCPDEYRAFFCERVAQAAAEAWNNRKPAGLSNGFEYAVVGHNRRLAYLDGRAQMYGPSDCRDFAGPEGPQDPGIDMVFTWNRNRRLTGVVVAVACPSQSSEGSGFITADFWYEARNEIRKRLGKNLFILPLCAVAGDQSPHILVRRSENKAMQERSGMTLRQQIGERIGHAVESAYRFARKDIQMNPELRHSIVRMKLPPRQVTKEEYRNALAEYRKLVKDRSLDDRPVSDRAASTRISRIGYEKSVIDRYEHAKKNVIAQVHTCRIGDMAVATNPFELFVDYGFRIRERSPATQTMLVQLTGPFRYYLPTREAVQGRSYSGIIHDNFVGPEGGEELVERTLKMIKKVWT